MAVTTDPTQIAKAIQQIAFAQKLAQAVSNLRNQGGGNTPVGNSGGGGGSGVVASTLAGLPQSPLLEQLKAQGLIKEGMPAEQALSILNLANIRGGIPLDIQTLTDQIKADYSNLTGDITGAGADWMKQLYGDVAPQTNDQYASLFAQDPTFSSYAGGLAQIDETANANEATDLAWFQKQQEMEQGFIDNLMQYTASGGLTPTGSGGGGGGGGRGYGGGGGGGGGSSSGSGDLGFGDTKTTVTADEFARATTSSDMEAENPNFALDFMDWMGQAHPQDAEEVRSLLRINPDVPDFQRALEEEIMGKDAGFIMGLASRANNQQWLNREPSRVDTRMRDFMAQNGITLGDDTTTPEVEPYYFSENFQNGAPNPNFGTPVNDVFALGMPAGPASTGMAGGMDQMAWKRNQQLFSQLFDPTNMTQNINPTGLQGTDLRDQVSGISGGVRDLVKQYLANQMNAGGIGAGHPIQPSAQLPANNSVTPSAQASPTTTPINNSTPNVFDLGNLFPSIQGPPSNPANMTPPAPQDPNSYAYDPATGMTWDPINGEWSTTTTAQGAVTGVQPTTAPPSSPVTIPSASAGTAPGNPANNPFTMGGSMASLYPTEEALQIALAGNNTNQTIAGVPPGTPGLIGSNNIQGFLATTYPNLSPAQQQIIDTTLNAQGIATPGSNNPAQFNQGRVASLLGNLNGGSLLGGLGSAGSPQRTGLLGSLLGGRAQLLMNPNIRKLLSAPDNLTETVNRIWQGYSQGGNLNLEQRPEVAETLQTQSNAQRAYDAYLQGVPQSELVPSAGDYWNSDAPTDEYLQGLQRTAAAMREAADVTERRNEFFNYVNTHAGGGFDTQQREGTRSTATSWEDIAGTLLNGLGDANQVNTDTFAVPGSMGSNLEDLQDTNVSTLMPDNLTLGMPSRNSDAGIATSLINNLIANTNRPTATPTATQRSQVGNLAGAFKQTALRQQAAPQLDKIRSLLAGVKKNFG